MSTPSLPVVTAIIQRIYLDKKQILIQTRWKPDRDPVYSGTFEIAAGVMDAFESVYDALRREVFEETGLRVVSIFPKNNEKVYSTGKDDLVIGFEPFYCHQQIKNGRPWVGFAFICEVAEEEPKEQEGETKDIRWINLEEFEDLVRKKPEQIFALQLPILERYFEYIRNGAL